jgi:tetratricopeptide (TPR) repeat protein
VSNLTPIYAHDRKVLNDALAEFRFLLRRDLKAAIPDWLKAHAPLVAEQRSLVDTSKLRPRDAHVTLTVVFIDEGGEGQGRLGELLMERIDANATGELYPAMTMAGVRTDADWRGAMEAARKYAAVCGFGIMPGSDVRWSIRVLKAGEKLEEHKSQPLNSGEKLIGRSAGVAFFLGLFALAKTDGNRAAVDARKVVEYMIALATFPEADPRTADDRLGTLGGTEKKKLKALKSLPEGAPVVVVFPMAYPESFLIRYKLLPINTIADLAAELRQRSATPTWPDSLLPSRRAIRYIGNDNEVEQLKESLRGNRLHVVSGPGGVGKTARVVEATDALLQEGVFPGGRFWIDLCGADDHRRKAGKVIATTHGFEAEDKFDELRDQTRLLLAKPSLILLEGAETVAEGEIAGLLDWFTGPTTVVWMTRQIDVRHRCLRGAKHHPVQALSQADALELLCYAAERNVEELSPTERADLKEIAEATGRLPLFLGWAGAAIQPDRPTTASEYLAELKDPLNAIVNPDDPEQNAGLFLSLSLARIVATVEIPDLPAVAKRLFAGLAAFDTSYGAPLSWWPLAAGLDANKSKAKIAAAQRTLIGLGLLTAEDSPPGAGASTKTVHVVHALAGAVAADLWRGQPAGMVAALGSLCKAATAALKTPLPVDGFWNAAWLVRRTSEAAHYGHWVGEIAALALEAASDRPLKEAELLRRAWVEFLENDAEPQPLFGLKETAWAAVCRHTQQIAEAHPEVADLLRQWAVSWDRLGSVRLERQEFSSAEIAFNQGMEINKKLAEEHPDVADYQDGLAGSWVHLGEVHKAREEWADAEAAFNEAKAICKKLTEAYPDLAAFQHRLALLWQHLGDIHKAQRDWAGGEQAFDEAKAICKKLTELYPKEVEFWRSWAVSWGGLGYVRLERQDWAGAKTAINVTRTIWKKLAELFPDVADFQNGLAVSWDNLADVCVARQDWADAEAALREALRLAEDLTSRWSAVPLFEESVIAGMWRLAQLQHRLGRAKEAATLARRGLARAERMASLLQETGAEPTERQEQIIGSLADLAGPETGADGQ